VAIQAEKIIPSIASIVSDVDTLFESATMVSESLTHLSSEYLAETFGSAVF
jgi:hypothetical protein